MLVIEPLSQSDRANFPTVAFQTNRDPKSGGYLFARLAAKGNVNEHQSDTLRSADYGNLPEMRKRDEDNGSHPDLVRRWP
jgi:hypothetical protein